MTMFEDDVGSSTIHYNDAPIGLALPQRSHAISHKLNSVLSSSFADAEIREALRTLDERQTHNSPEIRRWLRLDTQKEVIDRNGDIIQNFGLVAERLRRVRSTIANLHQCCEYISRQIQNAHRETGPILEEASTLFLQMRESGIKEELLKAFEQRFVMTDDEEEILISLSAPVDDKFFVSLSCLKRIHVDCQLLLGTENQQLGLDLMEKCTRLLDSAFHKLFRWIQRELKNLNLENPQIGASIRRSLRLLAERPILFQSCLDLFAKAREQSLSDSFYGALTGSSSSKSDDPTAKPIEYHAYDPLRFIGDMLAWTHSTAVSEREALELLFISEDDEIATGIKAGIETEPWFQDITEAFDSQRPLEQLVDRDLTGVNRALRQRMELVIQGDEYPIVAFKTVNLIDFYRMTFTKLLGPKSFVLEMLCSLRQVALQKYRSKMQDRVNSIHLDTIHAPESLDIPNFLDEALGQLKELLKSCDSSLASAVAEENEFFSIFSEALDPFLEGCEKIANELEEPSTSVFAINCLSASKFAISSFEFTKERVVEIDDKIAEYFLKLVDYQHAFFLHTSGLYPLFAALAPLSDSEQDTKSIPQLEPFQVESLNNASQVLDDFLPSALIDAVENLKLLKNSIMSEDITTEAANRFCEDFEFVERKLVAADRIRMHGGEYDKRQYGEESEDGGDGEVLALRTLFPRTTGEIRVLLS